MNITFIGLGGMGAALVERLLLTNKHVVTVFNRTTSKTLPLVELGAQTHDTVEKCVLSADVVITCLLDDKAVMEVTEQILPFLPAEAIHIGLSTISVETADKIYLLHNKMGKSYVSAVALGIPSVAREGKLTVFCAGDEKSMCIAEPLLAIFAKSVIKLGNESCITSPILMKICMNYSAMVALELISELYVFAEKSGLDQELVKIGLHQIYGHAGFKHYINKIADRDFDTVNFNMVGGHKDARIFQEALVESGVQSGLSAILMERFQDALSIGMHEKDWSGIYEVVRMRAGLV